VLQRERGPEGSQRLTGGAGRTFRDARSAPIERCGTQNAGLASTFQTFLLYWPPAAAQTAAWPSRF